MKLTKRLYDQILRDLIRPHKFAAERIGFLFARMGQIAEDCQHILFTDYFPVADDLYIDDRSVGARINGTAIREAMQRIIDMGEGAFHVHLHEFLFNDHLGFSRTDNIELNRLIPSFQTVGPNVTHGALLFGGEQCMSRVWLPTQKESIGASKISVIGNPLQFFEEA